MWVFGRDNRKLLQALKTFGGTSGAEMEAYDAQQGEWDAQQPGQSRETHPEPCSDET